jgi:hypothetical protein
VTGARRSALMIEFSYEQGHHFNLVIQQHKGMNYVGIESGTEN